MNTTHWLRAADCPLLQSDLAAEERSSPRLVLRLLDLCLTRPCSGDLTDTLLEEIGVTLRADQVAVLAPASHWSILWHYQRPVCCGQRLNLPHTLLDEVLDRRAGSSRPPSAAAPAFLAVTVPEQQQHSRLLLAARAREAFSTGELEYAVAAGHYLGLALDRIREWGALLRGNAAFAGQLRQGSCLVGECTAIRELRDTLERVAPTHLPVLILGESGTGKDVAARALHFSSKRHAGPFVPVQCAGVAESSMEGELFGHEAAGGSEAGALRAGKFEAANGGTLFLDEVGDLSAGSQARLLRVLEEKLVYRNGGAQPLPVDTRLVAGSNRNLGEAVCAGRFRKDLFYRLSVVKLELPPLRQRQDDVYLLADFFLQQFGKDAGRRPPSLSNEARERLGQHDWPGNVRELRNLVERVVYLCPRDRVEPEDLPFPARSNVPATEDFSQLTLARATDAFQASHIRKAIARTGGNMSDAAKLLGLHRPNLYRKMRLLRRELEGK